MPTIIHDKKLTIVISFFNVDKKNQAALINAQIENSQKMMEKKGFVSANLHKSYDGLSVVNYSQWSTYNSYKEAANVGNSDALKIGEKIFEIADQDSNIYELVFSAGSNSTTISKNVAHITVINKFSVEPNNQNLLLKHLDDLRMVVEKLTGFISANIHKSIDGTRVVSYAQWKSKENYQAVYTNLEAKHHLDEIKKISKFNWNFYEVVYTTAYNQ
jgi:heme-degrading monooxygenase HmoA